MGSKRSKATFPKTIWAVHKNHQQIVTADDLRIFKWKKRDVET